MPEFAHGAAGHAVPAKKMDRRQDVKTLGEVFEKDQYNNPLHFDGKVRRADHLTFLIPFHQRWESWSKEAKQKIVDTVFRNYPMGGFVLCEHVSSSKIYYDFEDGQSRMTILQEFYNNEFAFKTDDGRDVFFRDLSPSDQRRFENYKVSFEIMCNAQPEAICEVFERLQGGQPLKDKDHYWNLRQCSYVQKAMTLIACENWLGSYMSTSNGITDKNRVALPSVVTFIFAIIHYHEIKDAESSPSLRKSMWKSFRAQRTKLDGTINAADNIRIEDFLKYLKVIIDNVYATYAKQHRETVATWCNLTKQTGMILHEWLENEDVADEVKRANQQKWIEMMVLERKSGDFMFKGKKTMWNGFRNKHRQNTDDESIATRLERVNEFYANRQEVAPQHAIKYCVDDADAHANDDAETTDSEETW